MSHEDPLERFRAALAIARAHEPFDPTAMALATADARGRPSVRMVLLKDVDARGFVFYTNYGSRKAHDLDANPFAAVTVHWPKLEEQVRAEGPVERLSEAESDAYFASRPRMSRVGAWASRQSEPLASREVLLRRVAEVEARFPDEVPRPPFWGGFRLVPERVEFWKGRSSRLHDRELYVREGDGFRIEMLFP
ncbi:MAG TPA: pyridoxamine 5'-phosphate oxidase [Minicystis sp.]|nr:pyridoxamine 5'-phosphate oxidase [Minicystis sp.]